MGLGVLVVGAWLVVLFAGILSRADELEATAEAERATVDALTTRAELVSDEIEFVDSDRFVEQAARALGQGTDEEILFRLPADAPPPPSIDPLGPG